MGKPKTKRNAAPTRDPQLHLVQPGEARFSPPPPLRPQTEAQRQLLSSLRSNTLTVSEGSAGTGKTYVALAYAADLLRAREIDKLVLTRPLVGVDGEDEKIGALPGELESKMYFWALPMMDILEERLSKAVVKSHMRQGRIVVAPMAFLRGASLNDAFIHCTEAQNSSIAQMKMLLTRVGNGSKACVEGDTRQSDLRRQSGLSDMLERLEGMRDVGFVSFTRDDVARSGFCQAMLDRYE